MPTEQQLVDAYTRRALLLLRVGRGMGVDAAHDLRALAKQLRRLLADADLPDMGRRDLAALLREIDALVQARYADLATRQSEALATLAATEAAWAGRTAGAAREPSSAATTAAITGLLVLGLPPSRHWQRQADNLIDRIAGTIRTAQATGQPARDVLDAIIGQGPRDKERGGLLEGARQQAATLADTSAHAAAYAGRQAAWKTAGVKYLKWHAILDSRTTIRCATRAGKTYTTDFQPVGHDIPMGQPPPAHFNCRSILVGMAPDYEPPGDGQDPYSESLDAWLKRQPEAMQDEMLGPTRAALWRAGKLDTRSLLGRDGEVLSVAELVDLHATPQTQIALWWKRPKGDIVAARVPDELRAALGASSNEAVVTSYFRKKQLANHPEMDAEIYTRLSEMLSTPRVAVKQGLDNVLIIEDGGRPLIVVLRPDRQGRILVRSLHFIRARELKKLVEIEPIYGDW